MPPAVIACSAPCSTAKLKPPSGQVVQRSHDSMAKCHTAERGTIHPPAFTHSATATSLSCASRRSRASRSSGCSSTRAACCAGSTSAAPSSSPRSCSPPSWSGSRTPTRPGSSSRRSRSHSPRCGRSARSGTRKYIAGRSRRPSAYLQTAYDMVLVTAVVHLTGGGTSQFSALYVLVVAVASLIQPAGGGLLTAALGIALYAADAIWFQANTPSGAVWLQLSIIAVVAIGSASIGAKLQQAGAGREELAATLTHARHQAADILHNIRAGVITIDAAGQLVYANPSASQLLGIGLEGQLGRPHRRRPGDGGAGACPCARGCSPARHAHDARRGDRHRRHTPIPDRHHDDLRRASGQERHAIGAHRHGDLPGHLRPQAPGDAAAAYAAPGGRRGAERLARARDQEPARLDPQCSGAAVEDAARERGRADARGTGAARERPAVTAALGIPRLCARARSALRARWTCGSS